MLTKNRITQGLPIALAALLTACGGSSGYANQPATALKAETVVQSTETTLTPLSAIASSVERGDLSAASAIDHNDGTRWGSGFTDDQYLTLDFGKSVAINRVRIAWENAHASEYLLQVSDDNATWSNIKTVQDSQGGTEDWSGLSGMGRYLRMKGIKRSSQYGYSIYEIQAFSGTPASPTPTPQPQPGDPAAPGVFVKPVAATSSALENAGLSAAAAIDAGLYAASNDVPRPCGNSSHMLVPSNSARLRRSTRSASWLT